MAILTDRRSLVMGGISVFGAVTAGSGRSAAQPAIRIRHNAATASGQEMLALYRKAVGRMKTRFPRHDPRNWYFQANIHGYPEGSGLQNLPRDEQTAKMFDPAQGRTSAEKTAIANHRKLALGVHDGPASTHQHGVWHSCLHYHSRFVEGESGGERFFLSWHRIYMHYLEDIIRSVLDPADPPFAMPYWDYTHTDRSGRLDQLKCPVEFVEDEIPNGSPNHLYYPGRNSIFIKTGLPPRIVQTRELFSGNDELLEGGPFGIGFNGIINRQPHGRVHGVIGGGMNSFEYAGRDPIFWLHHANIDRLWESWRLPAPDGQSSRDPQDTEWLDQKFAFAGPNGERPDMAVRQSINLSNKMKVQYDRLQEVPIGSAFTGATVTAAGVQKTLSESQEAATPEITEIDKPVSVMVLPSATEEAVSAFRDKANSRYFLRIDVEVDEAPGGLYEVYARLPTANGTEEVLLDVFDLFGPKGGGKRTVTWTADITSRIRQNQIDPLKPLELKLRAQYAKPTMPVRIKNVRIRVL